MLTKQATIKVSIEENKQNNTCTAAVPAHEGSGIITTCGMPSRITCNAITPGIYLVAVVHSYTRKRGLKMTTSSIQRKATREGKKREKKRIKQRGNERTRKENENETEIIMPALRAQAES